MDAGMGPGGLGCLGVWIGYTIVAFIVFVILGVMLNSRFKNKVQQGSDDKPFDLGQIKEDKYHDIIRYYTESDEEHKARKWKKSFLYY